MKPHFPKKGIKNRINETEYMSLIIISLFVIFNFIVTIQSLIDISKGGSTFQLGDASCFNQLKSSTLSNKFFPASR